MFWVYGFRSKDFPVQLLGFRVQRLDLVVRVGLFLRLLFWEFPKIGDLNTVP